MARSIPMLALSVVAIIHWGAGLCEVCFGQPAQPVGAAAKTTTPDPDDTALLTWWDTLALPDFSQRKLVRVAVYDDSDEAPDIQPRGFLLKEDDQRFTVFFLDLGTTTYRKKGKPPDEDKHFTVLDLASEAAAYAKDLGDPLSQIPSEKWSARNFGSMTTEQVKAAVLARACAAQKLPEVAHTLLKQAAFSGTQDPAKPLTLEALRKTLNADIGNTMIWHHVLALGNPDIDRPELLRRFREFSRVFPDSQHALRAVRTAATLARMVEEDVQHAKTARPFEQLTKPERVAELIYQLRDQNGQQWSQPGSCSVFADPRDQGMLGLDGKRANPSKGSPATQLVTIGYDAVPQLMDHLGDEQLSRSIGFHRNFYFSHHALSVGECIEQILQSITGRELTPFIANMSAEDRRKAVHSAAQEWWTDVREKGERQFLIDDTAKGGSQCD